MLGSLGAPELIIGRARDMPDVGMFSRAGGLVEVVHRLLVSISAAEFASFLLAKQACIRSDGRIPMDKVFTRASLKSSRA